MVAKRSTTQCDWALSNKRDRTYHLDVNEVNVDILLYGNGNGDFKINAAIVESVHQCIHDSDTQ